MIVIFAMVVASCEKGDFHLFEKKHKDKICATVPTELVPRAVKDAFTAKYPDITINTWFKKDDEGYTALFTNNGVQTRTQFSNDGTFVNEEVDSNDGEHKDDSGCSCELNSED